MAGEVQTKQCSMRLEDVHIGKGELFCALNPFSTIEVEVEREEQS